MIQQIISLTRRTSDSKLFRIGATSFLLALYTAYVVFIIKSDQGPVDYETFMHLGGTLLEGGEVYGENSYYPLPYVGIFALFSLLPRPLSMAIWLLGPVFLALTVTRYRPYTLLFAPVFSHFAGGQSSVFGLIGFFGYRLNLDPSSYIGGLFLALTCLKPQLAIVPIGYAAYNWIKHTRENRQIPKQLISFVGLVALMYIPSFLLRPTWLQEWLSVPRPLFNRALSSGVPRLLFYISSPGSPLYWLLWLFLTAAILAFIWKLKGNGHSLDILLLASFIVNPLVHDYDLIQILPTIWGPIMPLASVALSLPGWWTITTNYGTDAAWVTFIIIAPGLLITYILQCRRNLEIEAGSLTTRPIRDA